MKTHVLFNGYCYAFWKSKMCCWHRKKNLNLFDDSGISKTWKMERKSLLVVKDKYKITFKLVIRLKSNGGQNW